MIEPKSKYLQIIELVDKDKKASYQIFNIQQNVCIGYIRKRRVGQFLHWCLEPESDTYFTNGCLKEITLFITGLYSKGGENGKL